MIAQINRNSKVNYRTKGHDNNYALLYCDRQTLGVTPGIAAACVSGSDDVSLVAKRVSVNLNMT